MNRWLRLLACRMNRQGGFAMASEPMPYTPEKVSAVHRLYYGWTGWPSAGTLPQEPGGGFWQALDADWGKDGLKLEAHNWTDEHVQVTLRATPRNSPVFVAQRAKGRLQHHLRLAGTPVKFSRKVGLRSLGNNTRAAVEAYVRGQVGKEPVADERFRQTLRQFTVESRDVDLTKPTATNSGRYWYNLHVVLVVASRFRVVDTDRLAVLRDAALRLARENGHGVRVLSVLPDHLHASLRGSIERTPEEVALTFLNGLALAQRRLAFWQAGYYVGTFSEYDLDAVRR
jgi:REP element-mobilizing transposase RayT